jgi:hypothetical protein
MGRRFESEEGFPHLGSSVRVRQRAGERPGRGWIGCVAEDGTSFGGVAVLTSAVSARPLGVRQILANCR